MINIHQTGIDKKNQIISDITAKKSDLQNEEFDLYLYILEVGKVVFLNQNFSIDKLTRNIKEYMQSELSLNTETTVLEKDIYRISYTNAKGFKKMIGVSGKFDLFILQFENELLFTIKPTEWLSNPQEKESVIASWFKDSYEEELDDFIAKSVFDEFFNIEDDFKINFNNEYTEILPENLQVWYYTIQEEAEIMLANIKVPSLKEHSNNNLAAKKLDIYLIFTTKGIVLVGFDKNGDNYLYDDISGKVFEHKKGLLKSEVKIEETVIQVSKNTLNLLSEISEIKKFDESDKLREIIRLNFKKENYEYAEKATDYLVRYKNETYDELCLFYVKLKKEENIPEGYDTNKTTDILLKILNYEHTKDYLVKFTDKWEFSYTDKSMLLRLMSEIAENEQQKINILAFYDVVREEFMTKSSDSINKSLFEINYAQFLIDCNKNEEAVTVLKNLYDNLPDESVSDLLPNEKLDLTSDSSGQLLKITVLDMLTKVDDKEKAQQYTQQTALLQPLNQKRLKLLQEKSTAELSSRAGILSALLEPSGISDSNDDKNKFEYKALKKNTIEDYLRYPASRKKGGFYDVQKWLSKVKVEDYSAVKSFSEKLSIENYNDIYLEIKKIKNAFSIDKIETYFARGDKSIGITGYAGEPPFLIIGYDHIDKNSKHYLTLSELRFSVGVEIAHIYFKHSRITSNDVWRGVADKGYLFIDTWLSLVPAAGLLGNSIKYNSKLSNLSDVLLKTKKISEKGNILEAALLVNRFYKKIIPGKNKENKQQLLAASRLMQFTADRAGLLLSGDLKSAVRAILITGKSNFEYLNEISEKGLYNFLTEQNSDETFKHQDMAVRLTNLFSFYISEDYYNLRKMLIS